MDLSNRAHFALTADLVVFAFDGAALRVLLVRRAQDPFAGRWALPGGFVENGETLEDCARRELAEETGLELRRLDQLAAFFAIGRDPRGPVVSVAYLALTRAEGLAPRPGGDADATVWRSLDDPPPLAFDHDAILALAQRRLAAGLYATRAAFDLLPDAFTLAEAQTVFELAAGQPLDKRNFRAWAQAKAPLEETGAERRGPHRPAKLYRVRDDASGDPSEQRTKT